MEAFPCSGERREVGNAESFAHVVTSAPPHGWALLLKAWAVLTFHTDGSHQAPGVEAGWFSKAWLCKLCGDERDSPILFEGVCGKQRVLQILLQGVGSVASSNRALASLPLAPGGPPM